MPIPRDFPCWHLYCFSHTVHKCSGSSERCCRSKGGGVQPHLGRSILRVLEMRGRLFGFQRLACQVIGTNPALPAPSKVATLYRRTAAAANVQRVGLIAGRLECPSTASHTPCAQPLSDPLHVRSGESKACNLMISNLRRFMYSLMQSDGCTLPLSGTAGAVSPADCHPWSRLDAIGPRAGSCSAGRHDA